MLDERWVFHENAEPVQAGPGVVRRVLAYSKDLMCVENTFEEGAVGSLHHHPHSQICAMMCWLRQRPISAIPFMERPWLKCWTRSKPLMPWKEAFGGPDTGAGDNQAADSLDDVAGNAGQGSP